MVSTIHVADWEAAPDLRERTKLRLAARARRHCASQVIAVSAAARTAYVARGWRTARPMLVVHNGIAADATPGAGSSVRRELGLSPHAVVLGMLSVLRPGKGHDDALTALEQLADVLPDLRLLVVGDGPLRDQLQQRAGHLGDRVCFAGYRSDVMPVLDAVDMLLQPSSHDALPTAVIEALAAGVPVIGAAVGGIPELVDHHVTGLLVPPGSGAAGLADAVRLLASDGDRRRAMGRAARARFERDLTAAAWAERLRKVYLSSLPRSAT
jgi:glycosyltransferase involved in cell wall biosynthesis